MNICLFIFLFHFASNKEKFFLSFNDNEKYEFTLNPTSDGGKSLYKKLKVDKTIPLSLTSYNELLFLAGEITLDLENEPSQTGEAQKGEIVYALSSSGGNLYILTGNKTFNDDSFERVGNIIISKSFENFGTYQCKLLLVEEKDDTPKKKKKSGNWKTIKIMKIVKALKRYRLVKKLEKLKGLKN